LRGFEKAAHIIAGYAKVFRKLLRRARMTIHQNRKPPKYGGIETVYPYIYASVFILAQMIDRYK